MLYWSKYIYRIVVLTEIYCRFTINRLSYHTTGWHLLKKKKLRNPLDWGSFVASDAVWMRSALCWGFTQCRTTVPYRRFGTTCWVPICLTLEDRSDFLSRNVGDRLQFYAEQNLKRAQISMGRGMGAHRASINTAMSKQSNPEFFYLPVYNLATDIDCSSSSLEPSHWYRLLFFQFRT